MPSHRASTASATPTPTSPQPTPTSIAPPSLSGAVSSSAVAVSPDGAIVAAVNPDSDSITLVDAVTLEVLQELPVGDDPRTLVFTPDSQLVLVANHGSATVSIVMARGSGEVIYIPVGPMPYGVVTDGVHAYVAEFSLGNVSVINLATGILVTRIPVEGFPAGLALNATGETLIVTHLFSGRVT
ncbi:MAG: YncE family protein, partial [Gemmatimonadetes bacterium]|nr:YncE family protein [Gemmatimonadota bacterium]